MSVLSSGSVPAPPSRSHAVPRLAEMTWPEVAALDPARVVALLPVGAVEAHGPHLPLSTDGVIAEAMARSAGERLARRGLEPLLLPTVDYTAAPYAAGFAGTLSVRPATVTALVIDLGETLADHGVRLLAVANAHLDPANLRALAEAASTLRSGGRIAVALPDVTRRPWASRLSEEFKSGACHAGRYEGSVVLAERPELVREEVRATLAENPASLSEAIGAGLDTFEAAGGPQAYFGDPAAATAEEGRDTVKVLGEILEEAVMQEIERLARREEPGPETVDAAPGSDR